MSIVQRHRINFHPQEVQALLKACLIYKVEQFRQAGKSTGHLFYDIQQEMAKYGEFPERPLFHLRAHYRRVQKRYKQGRKPYPPEARELWGRLEEETDDQVKENDETWKALTEQIILLEAGCRYLTKSELAELIQEAIEKDVETQLDEQQAGKQAVCSICQGCAYEAKHLFRDVYQNQTYAELINRILNVKMVWNGHSSAVICQLCSTYVEGLQIFWNQCRESCVKLNFELVTKEEPVLEEPTFWESNSGAKTQSIDKSKALSEDQRTKELTREELNMLKFKESLPSSSKRKDKKAKQCDLCGKTVIDLKTHLDSHYNIKSHACDLCPKKFTSRHQLRSHRNTHTGAIKYACSYCDAVFDVWQSKKYHEKKHVVEMNNISYNCDQCNATFKVERNLQHHIKFKHLQMAASFSATTVRLCHNQQVGM
ncbi:hypothetical protein pipiens_018154 [Culex pipiens pipiens]|uniref:C2H2-type domain-containing protein n=1 Tax=Culex pipiens pipiens TaxID=38569 RepID=A0ABD1CD55_CULPP